MDYTTVTELAGDDVSGEQIDRIVHRYSWASTFCTGKDVLEVGCGAGQGLGCLASVSRTIVAGDITPGLVKSAQAHYGDRIDIRVFDALKIPFDDASFDVVVLFESIYYLSSAEQFVDECRRVLRPNGRVLIATANKDLYDFNPSPYSHRYYGVEELGQLFGSKGFDCEFYGTTATDQVSLAQRILRPLKMVAARLRLIPKTMAGKKLLKRLVFGKLQPMPAEITPIMDIFIPPVRLPSDRADHKHKVLYLVATLN